MTATAPQVRRKLPFWSTIGEAFSAPFGHAGQLARIAGLWVVIALGIFGAMHALLGAEQIAAMQKGSLGSAGFNLISMLVGLIIGSSIAVAWHRLLLTGEPVEGVTYLRFDGRVWTYLAYAGLLILMALPFLGTCYVVTERSLALGDTGGELPPDQIAFVGYLLIAMFVTGVIAFLIPTRLSIVLPARALGHDGVTLGDSWRLTQGSFWRLFGGTTICTVPLIIAAAIVGAVTPEEQSVAAFIATNTVLSALGILFSVLPLGFLSYAYRHFAGSTPEAGKAVPMVGA